MKIIASSTDPTIAFAAEELARYMEQMRGTRPGIENGTGESGLRLCMFPELDGTTLPPVADPSLDDAIHISTSGKTGVIAGTNPRSVLIAVYRYLTELGCRWIRPSSDGEIIPQVDIVQTAVSVTEAASYRHRALCIEGSVSYEHVRDIIDWMPKHGFNSYLTQFRESYTFFERWYKHLNNPTLEPEEFPVERARQFKRDLTSEMKRRGIVFHDVGHGWTCEPLGMPGLGWDVAEAPPESVHYLAEVNGERKLWGGVPLNTNLCYSNPEVRRLMLDDIVAYAGEHPEVDIIHFWLADGSNNHCECENCVRRTPSDWYVLMLNDLDEKLSEAGLPTRIVFLIYVDLLWAPVTEKIANPDRFILMFAPITRTYSKPFSAEAELPPSPPYERNKLEFPRAVEGNIRFLKDWQEVFPGDSFDFDYHFMWDIFKDPGHWQLPMVLHADIRNLRDIGLGGYMGCQVQRAFFPSGLGMWLMGRNLWHRDAGFDEVADDYVRCAFGQDGQLAREYLEELSSLFDPPYLRVEKPALDPEAAERFSGIPAYIDSFRPVIERNLNHPEPAVARSWHYLDSHADIAALLAQALSARASGDKAAAHEHWESTAQLVREREIDLQTVLDVFWFIQVLQGLFPEG